VADTIDYTQVTKSVTNYAKKAHHFTIEALSVGVARICCLGFGVEEVTVRYLFNFSFRHPFRHVKPKLFCTYY
jgi:dihydroneopterin aldolase